MNDNKLTEYYKKRDFNKTSEPKGNLSGKKNIFVIQEHKASHLHYDFRLEVDGVLKSWAIPKGIPTALNEKHLAIQTEDHPIDYADFEGEIPVGEYGAGTVKIWDHGSYEQIGLEHHTNKSMIESLKAGAFKIRLHGKKLKVIYSLVRFKQEHGKNEWLIFKSAEQGRIDDGN